MVKKIIQELKDSKKYQYSNPIKVREGMYQEFQSHDHDNVSIGILTTKEEFQEIHICIPIPDSYEQGVGAKVFEDISLEEANIILEILIRYI